MNKNNHTVNNNPHDWEHAQRKTQNNTNVKLTTTLTKMSATTRRDSKIHIEAYNTKFTKPKHKQRQQPKPEKETILECVVGLAAGTLQASMTHLPVTWRKKTILRGGEYWNSAGKERDSA